MNLKYPSNVQQPTETLSTSSFASRVYGWLTAGLGLTSLITFMSCQNGWYATLAPLNLWIVLAAFGVSMVISLGIQRISFATAAALFVTYSLLQGLLFGTIVPLYALRYGGELVWVAFATAGVLFAAATIYGRMSRSDLTQMAQLLNFGVGALLVVTLISFLLSFFMQVTLFDLLIAYLGLAIFLGLIVTDSQQIRQMSQLVSVESQGALKLSLIVALRMYINVLMVFMYLLRIFASSRNSR